MGDSVKKDIGNRLETTFHIGINWENITDHNRLGIIGKISHFFINSLQFRIFDKIQFYGYNWNGPQSYLWPWLFWAPQNLCPEKFGLQEIWSPRYMGPAWKLS